MKVAVGFFDGVHLGHRRILSHAEAALTFADHPARVLAPDRVPPLLMPPAERLAAIAAALHPSVPDAERASRVRALAFSAEWAACTPAAFAAWLRETYPRLTTVLCGPNWTFGAKGAGTPDVLRTFGFDVRIVPFVRRQGEAVSSTRIRAALAAGDLATARAGLGRDFSLTGEVVPGKGVGRTWNVPTLNVRPPPDTVRVPAGVYAVVTPLGRGIANYGVAPTWRARAWTEPMLEVHLLADAQEDVVSSPPSRLTVSFVRFIRPERTFPSLDALREQIARDLQSC